jgi:hypothetical protein
VLLIEVNWKQRLPGDRSFTALAARKFGVDIQTCEQRWLVIHIAGYQTIESFSGIAYVLIVNTASRPGKIGWTY